MLHELTSQQKDHLRQIVQQAFFATRFAREERLTRTRKCLDVLGHPWILSPHMVVEALLSTVLHRDMQSAVGEKLTNVLLQEGLLDLHQDEHGMRASEERFVDLIAFERPATREEAFHWISKAARVFDDLDVTELSSRLQERFNARVFRGVSLRSIRVGRPNSSSKIVPDHAVQTVYDRIVHNWVDATDNSVHGLERYTKMPRASSKVVVSVAQATHMRNQWYGQVRLPVVFDFGTHQLVQTMGLLNAAFIFPGDQWAPLRGFVRPHRFGTNQTFDMLDLRGMTFYSLSPFNDVDMSEKMHGAGFFAPMAFLYEVVMATAADSVDARTVALRFLTRWEPGQPSQHPFLQAVSDAYVRVQRCMRDPSQLRRRTQRVYRATVEALLRSAVPDFAAVTFISGYSIEDDA